MTTIKQDIMKRREARNRWLGAHPDLKNLPTPMLIKVLKWHGFVAPTTYWRDVGLPKGWVRTP